MGISHKHFVDMPYILIISRYSKSIDDLVSTYSKKVRPGVYNVHVLCFVGKAYRKEWDIGLARTNASNDSP